MLYLILLLCWFIGQTGSITQAAEEQIPSVNEPPDLARFLPAVIHGFSSADVEGGRYRLISWTKLEPTAQCWSSRIELLDCKGGKPAKVVWKSPDEELYEPKIRSASDWKYHGHPLFVVFRNAGAEAVVVEPLAVENGRVVRFGCFDGCTAEIAETKGPKHGHQLVIRLCPQVGTYISKIYDWNELKFIEQSKRN